MKHAGKSISDGNPLLVGVINLSPESFYRGSVAESKVSIEEKMVEMNKFGVDCIDVGAMSTRPLDIYGGERASRKIEIERIQQYLPEIVDVARTYEIPIALDTQYAEVVSIGIKHNIAVINDISGFKTDEKMAPLLADIDVDIVIMATDCAPGDVCGIEPTISALNSSLDIAASHNIERNRISVDPGFGGWNGRGMECDLQLLEHFDKFHHFDLPIYVGVSRKSTIQTLGGGELSEDRLIGSVILTQKLIELGAHIIRTHDVKETRLGLNVFKSLRNY